MEKGVPPDGTPASEAFLSQGASLPGDLPNPYAGVDKWIHPRKDLPAGIIFAQFDHRDPADILASPKPVSAFFTDLATVQKFQTEKGLIDARAISQALQVRPWRAPEAELGSPYTYGVQMTFYQTLRPIEARNVERTQLAEFGHGRTRNNIHFGSGSAPQYYLPEAKQNTLQGPNALFKVLKVIPSDETTLGHQLPWLRKFEQQGLTNDQISARIVKVFVGMVKALQQSTEPQQQARGAEIKALAELNMAAKNNIVLASGAKLTRIDTDKKVLKAPTPSRQRGPRF